MKRSKSGAQKRKEAATARDAVAKLPKMTDFVLNFLFKTFIIFLYDVKFL